MARETGFRTDPHTQPDVRARPGEQVAADLHYGFSNEAMLVFGARHTGREVATMPHRSLARDEAIFLASVLIGTIGGIVTGQLTSRWTSTIVAGNVALAMATTLTGATHARLVHHRSIRSLLPSVMVGVPLAYLVMYGIHALLRA